MGHVTLHAVVANAAARMNPGRERMLLERAAEMLDFRSHAPDEVAAAGARLIEFEEDESSSQIGHICPHCKREPMPLAMHLTKFGVVPAFVFSCGGCRKVISVNVSPIPLEPQQPEETSSLILPGRRM